MSGNKTAVILQPFGIGDSIWCQTIAQRFKDAGYHILWPVLPQFVEGLSRAYPGIEFVDAHKVQGVDFDAKVQKVINGMLHVPIRWCVEIMNVPYHMCMMSKYDMYGWDWRDWKSHGMWVRDYEREKALFYDVLGLKDGDEYTLCSMTYRSDNKGRVGIKLPGKVVDLKVIEGYSLFDWALVIERAKEVHAVSSAILYVLELLDLKQPLHLYKRLPEETHFDNVQFLFSKPYILH